MELRNWKDASNVQQGENIGGDGERINTSSKNFEEVS